MNNFEKIKAMDIDEMAEEIRYIAKLQRQEEFDNEVTELKDELKRLEKENKELGRKAFLTEQNVRTTAAAFCEKYNKIIELEQENRELKKQIESQKGLITVGGKQQYDMTMSYDKLKTALEEIREIAEKYKNMEGCRIPLGAIEMQINEVL